MRSDEFRQQLIDGTIKVIAKYGLDKATARQLEDETGINFAYIYRCFGDKENMYAKTFESLDKELVDVIMSSIEQASKIGDYSEGFFRELFSLIWRFLTGNKDKLLCFVRYYYSPYFLQYSYVGHKKQYEIIIKKMSPIFKDEADVWMILNHILNVMLDFAIKVCTNRMPEEDNYTEHVFRVVYASVKQYFKNVEENIYEKSF